MLHLKNGDNKTDANHKIQSERGAKAPTCFGRLSHLSSFHFQNGGNMTDEELRELNQGYKDKDGFWAMVCFCCWVGMFVLILVAAIWH